MRYEFVFRMKLKQTEDDCELLKRYNEELVEENRKLRIELVQMSTLAMCPSCGRVSEAKGFRAFRP